MAEGQGVTCASASTARPARPSRRACARTRTTSPPSPTWPSSATARWTTPAPSSSRAGRSPSTPTTRLANYAYGLAAAKLGRTDDARDGFELAAQSVELRGAAWTELAKLALRGGRPRPRRLRRRAEPRLQPAQPRGAPAPRPGPPRRRNDPAKASAGRRRAARPGPAEPLRPFRGVPSPRAGTRPAPSPPACATRCRRRPSSSWPPGTSASAGRPRPRRCWSCRRRRPRSSTGWRAGTSASDAESAARPPEGRRGVARARLPLPPGVGRGPGVGGVEERELASPLLPGARPVGGRQRRRGAPPLRGVRRDARLRALLRRAVARLRGRLSRAVDGRPRAGGPPRPRAVALRPDAGRPASSARAPAATGAGDRPRLRRAVPRQLHPRHALREGAPRQRSLRRTARRSSPA